MGKRKPVQRTRSSPIAGSNQAPQSTQPFWGLIVEEAKKQLAKRLVQVAFAAVLAFVALLIFMSLAPIPGAYVDPDGVNWTFFVSDDPPAVLAMAQKPEWFGLHYRNIPALEPMARNAVNGYLAKHKPNCTIFSINGEASSNPDTKVLLPDTKVFLMPRGEKLVMSPRWGVALECK